MRVVVAGGSGTVGRHVVREARERGHDVISLSRRTGQDLLTGEGVAEALAGADVVIDVSSTFTTNAAAAVRFFETATSTLQRAERAAGVAHHVTLSIVGIDDIDAGYYAGKLVHERLVRSGDVPWSLLRATQFHELAEQALAQAAFGPIALAPRMPVRPVAAREVAAVLVDSAEYGPSGRLADLAGPRDEELPEMIRRMSRHDGVRRLVLPVSLPGPYWTALRTDVIRGADDARRGTITFDEWLSSDDHTR